MVDVQWTNATMNSSGAWNKSVEGCKPYTILNSSSARLTMIVAYSILLILILVGNSLIAAVFWRNTGGRLRTTVNYFIVNMSVSDLLIPLFVIPRRLQEIYLGWGPWLVDGVFGDILCKIVNLSEELSMAVSMQSMAVIAAERFWSVLCPMKRPIITRRHSSKIIAFTWIFALIFFSFYFFAYKLVHKKNNIYCEYSLPQVFDTWQDLWRADRIGVLVVFVATPFILMTIFYAAVIVTVCRQGRIVPQLALEARRQRAAENRKITFMLIVVLFLFFVSWSPHYLYFFLQYYSLNEGWTCDSMKRLYLSVKYMNYIYAAINPFVYYAFNEKYRRGVREMSNLVCPRCCVPMAQQIEQSQYSLEPSNCQTIQEWQSYPQLVSLEMYSMSQERLESNASARKPSVGPTADLEK